MNLNRDGHDVGGLRLVPQLEKEAALWWTGNGKRIADKAFRHLHRIGEARVIGDRVDEVKVRSGEGAGGCRIAGAVNVLQGRQTHQIDQGDPVSGGSVGSDGTKPYRAECGGSKSLQRVEGSEDGVRVLQDEAGGDREAGMEALVRIGDFDLPISGEGRRGVQREGEFLIYRKIVGVGEMDRRR